MYPGAQSGEPLVRFFKGGIDTSCLNLIECENIYILHHIYRDIEEEKRGRIE